MPAVRVVVHVHALRMQRGDRPGEFARAFGWHGRVLSAERDGKRHREAFGEVERAAGAVFVGTLRLRSAETGGDGVLELVVGEVVGERVEGRHAADHLRMACGVGERGRTAHRAAAEEDAPAEACRQRGEKLRHVGLGGGTHPRGFRAVVGRDERHAARRRHVACGPAFAAVLANLRAVAAVPVQVDENVNRPRNVLRRSQQILLCRAVEDGPERTFLEIAHANGGHRQGCREYGEKRDCFHGQ